MSLQASPFTFFTFFFQMLPEISSVIRLNPVCLEQSIDELLRREALHIISAWSDHKTGSIKSLLISSHDNTPAVQCLESSALRPSGKQAVDKIRRQTKRALLQAQYTMIPRSSSSKKFTKMSSIMVDYDAVDLPAAKGAFVSLRQ